MLRLALFFLVVSLIAALFGFGGIAAAAADIARILFFIFIVIFVVLLVAGLLAGSTLVALNRCERGGVRTRVGRQEAEPGMQCARIPLSALCGLL